MDPVEKAEELGMSIINSKEFLELDRVESLLEEDARAQEMIRAYQEKQAGLDRARHQGGAVDARGLQELREMQENMMENEIIRDLIMSRQGVEKLLVKVSQVLTRMVKRPFGVGAGAGSDCSSCDSCGDHHHGHP